MFNNFKIQFSQFEVISINQVRNESKRNEEIKKSL